MTYLPNAGLGLGTLPGAQTVSDTDVLPLAQPSQVGGSIGTLWRGTAAQLWSYMTGKLPSYRIPFLELSAATILDGPTHNRHLLVCTTSLSMTLPATFGNLTPAGVAFEAEVQVENGATLTLPSAGATITGPAAVVGPAQARLRAWTSSGGVNRFSCSQATTSTATPSLAITGVSTTTTGATATASLTFANGAPASITATMDGAALTIAGLAITTGSGTGATAQGTASFTFTQPATGAHTLVATGTGPYAATSNSFADTVAAAPGAFTISSVAPAAIGVGGSAMTFNVNYTGASLGTPTVSVNGTSVTPGHVTDLGNGTGTFTIPSAPAPFVYSTTSGAGHSISVQGSSGAAVTSLFVTATAAPSSAVPYNIVNSRPAPAAHGSSPSPYFWVQASPYTGAWPTDPTDESGTGVVASTVTIISGASNSVTVPPPGPSNGGVFYTATQSGNGLWSSYWTFSAAATVHTWFFIYPNDGSGHCYVLVDPTPWSVT